LGIDAGTEVEYSEGLKMTPRTYEKQAKPWNVCTKLVSVGIIVIGRS
jgi:hypothetical protein